MQLGRVYDAACEILQQSEPLIGEDFGLWTEGNLTAPFGTLVGQIGSDFEVLGTHFSGPAWGTGTLRLYYWDSNFADNTQFITALLPSVLVCTCVCSSMP